MSQLPLIVSSTLTIQGGSQLSINGANLVLGQFQTASGTVVLNDTSSLNADNEIIGDGGLGQFTQNGGTNTISGQLTLGSQKGSGTTGGLLSVDNTYTLSGGDLSAANLVVGDGGHGTFNQNGGTNTISGQLILGNQGGGGGVYNLSGPAVLEAGTEIFGS